MAFADVILPLWLVVSQWILLFALGFLIIVMYRQFALLQRLRDRGSEREGLPLGEKAPAFDLVPVHGSADVPVRFDPKGRWSLLVFADPTCVTCQSTLLALGRIAPKLEQSLHVRVVTNADPAQIEAVDAFRSAPVTISRIRGEVSSRLYRTSVTPFAYLIDPDGKIRDKGIPADESSIRKMVRKVAHSPVNVASIVS